MHLNVFINVAIEKTEFSHNTPHYVSEKGCENKGQKEWIKAIQICS